MSLLNTADALFIADREAHRAYLGANEVYADLDLMTLAQFAAGEQGAWFDNSDLDTLFEDSAGTSPAVVNGLVGRQLDKSGRGNHRSQTTTAFKPILRGTPIGETLLVNGDYALDAAGWTLNAHGTATFSGVGDSRKVTLTNVGGADRAIFSQAVATVPGRLYRVRITTMDDGTSGPNAADLRITNTTPFSGGTLLRITAGSARDGYFTATQTTTYFALGNGSSVAGKTVTFGVVELRDATADAVQAPYLLHYDGIDDYMVTSAVDFTGTDKMTVWVGARKLSDTSTKVSVELGTNIASVNGSFALWLPHDPTNEASFVARGSTTRYAIFNNAAAAAPVTLVATGTADIAGDLTTLRLDGALVVTDSNDLGAGNFGNLPIYFGRRAGSSLPFSGYEYQSIVRGAQSNARQIADGEALTAHRTGVTLP